MSSTTVVVVATVVFLIGIVIAAVLDGEKSTPGDHT